MKANQLATLVLRLLGIYCLIVLIPMAELLNNIIFYARNTSSGAGTGMVIMTLLLSVSWLAVGISLIVFSVPWGEVLTPKNTAEQNITVVSFEQIQILAFAVTGVLIFAEALPQLLNSIWSFFISLDQITGEANLQPTQSSTGAHC